MSATTSGRGWAYGGVILGGVVSIAANFAHSFVPPKEAPADWAPEPGAVIGAIIWPIFLFVAVEILARVAWPHGRRWQLLRFGGITPVALVAAFVSYLHLNGLLAFYGEDPLVCIFGPLAVDGLMVMATGALLATSQTQDTRPLAVSVPAAPNPVQAPALTPPAVPTPPAPDMVSAPKPITEPAMLPESVPATRTEPVPTPAQVAVRVTPSPTSIPLRPDATRPGTPSTRKPSPRKPQPTRTADQLAAPATDIPGTAPEPAQLSLPIVVEPGLLAKAREIAEQYRTETGTPIKPGQLAARLRVNSELASQALAVLDLGPNSPTDEIPTVNGHRLQKATR